jgi:transposase-like protein
MARYTEAEKADAVAHYLQHGLAAAHQATGVPKQTLQDWARKAGHNLADISGRTADQTRAATAARTILWEDRRTDLTHKLGDVAELALDKARELVEAGKPGEAQKAMVTAAIGIDKAQLLSGNATSRTETVHPDRTPEYEEVLDRTLRLVQARAS